MYCMEHLCTAYIGPNYLCFVLLLGFAMAHSCQHSPKGDKLNLSASTAELRRGDAE